MTDRRAFLHSVAASAATLTLPTLPVFNPRAVRRLEDASVMSRGQTSAVVAEDEAYWATIQRAFDLDRTMINLNNGGCRPAPAHRLDPVIRGPQFSEEPPVEHKWNVLEPRIESVRRELALDFGCDPEEMAITRNASEANETMIFGLDLKRGDEVILTTQNYPRMKNAWIQRQRRDRIVIKWVKLETPPRSASYYVEQIASAITPRTRVIETKHISFMTGYIAPVKQIVDYANPRGIRVFIDGAHAYAHFPFKRDDLGAVYYGTSLHKWLMAPIGTGFLYVRRGRIQSLWPMIAGAIEQGTNTRNDGATGPD